jgi:hypothetical protein
VTILPENKPAKAMAMELGMFDLCRAFEWYANEVLFQDPIFVSRVNQFSKDGLTAFRVEFVPKAEVETPGSGTLGDRIRERPEPLVDTDA